jgi:hypothetical protein
MRLSQTARTTIRLIGVGIALTLLLTAGERSTVSAQRARSRHVGYGISVAPHLPSRPDLLDELGMDWVKIYSTSQLSDYPNQHVLYRVDVPPNAGDLDSWEEGLYDLALELQGYGVAAVEIGNEPNLAVEWGGRTPDARQFAGALCRGYQVFKEVAPDIIVVAGGLASTITTPDQRAITDLSFAQEMFNAGAGQCFDAWGYHPYGYNQPPEADPNQNELVFRRTERMYNLLWKNGIRDKQIWITEFGWVRDPEEGGLDCSGDPEFGDFEWMKFPRELQAAYTVRAFAFAERNWPWVGPMFLWNLNWNGYPATDLRVCSHMRWYGILDEHGQPLPVFYAVKQMSKYTPHEYRPTVGAVIHGLTRTAEAGCAGEMHLGSFTVRNSGYPGHLDVEIEAANGPGRPVVWTSTDEAISGTEVEVYVDATGIEPGLHLIAVNLRAFGTRRMSSHVVRGWLLIHFPTSPECVARYGG